MRRIHSTARCLACILFAAAAIMPAAATAAPNTQALVAEVRHELVTLPYYGIFDHLAFAVNGTEVTLTGQVTRPTLKKSAERVVAKIEGVENVTNEIEVLPFSSFDNQTRVAVARAIYGSSVLGRYGLGAIPSIHIIVENGDVTLEGVVANEMDRNLAFIQANGVPGVFSVANNLEIEAAGVNG